MELKENKAVSLCKVKVEDAYLANSFEKELSYLMAFDTDRLLAGFRETAGVDMRGASRYGGWENMLIGGHTLGHYMTACVRACESANCKKEEQEELLGILKRLTDGLAECQRAGKTGFLFGAVLPDKSKPELQFDFVEENKTDIITQAWVPWYTMHKIFEGLISVTELESGEESAGELRNTAKTVLSQLTDWVYERVSGWSGETHRIVLRTEYGGMNDCLYDTYRITGKQEALTAAQAFEEPELYERVCRAEAGENVLNNLHANTTIPKFMGALKRYVVTGEERYLTYALRFWDLVTGQHTYITGGNSEWEHFGEDGLLDKERTSCNCETCNVYNMLKMTKQLFLLTGEVKYADWYENAFVNSILSSQHPETGMTTYFQPMASGYYKVYGKRFGQFWCCNGTGLENFTKLQESFYFQKGGMLLVNQYFSSTVEFQGVKITQRTDLPRSEKASFHIKGRLKGSLLFRLPYWLAGRAEIEVNGTPYAYRVLGDGPDTAVVNCVGGKAQSRGYAIVEGPFETDTEITVTLPMKVRAYSLPDSDNTYAFKYGPVVLSAGLGRKDERDTTTGVDVAIPGSCRIETAYVPSGTEQIVVLEGTVSDYMENIEMHLVRQGEEPVFLLTGTDANLTFAPHYSRYRERYGIYFNYVQKEGKQG